MGFRLFLLTFLVVIAAVPAGAQSLEDEKPDSVTPPVISTAEREKAKNINIDMQIVYGQYSNMLSTINLSQEHRDFVYLLSSYFKRSDDFGYNDRLYSNSSFYENKLGFTGNAQVADGWKAIFDAEVNYDSRGMFENALYSREEKDESNLSIKNIYKVSNSFETYLTLGGARFTHRHRPAALGDEERKRLNLGRADAGGEYIWSASNRLRMNAQFGYYEYRDNGPDDHYVSTEIIDDFNLTRNLGISFGLNCDVNRDDDPLVFPLLAVTVKGFEHAVISMLYRYDIVPFKPEEFYLEQKYILPDFDLPPARVHHGDLKVDVRANSVVNVKLNLMVEHNDNFYNYRTAPGNLLYVDPVPAMVYMVKLDSNFILLEKVLELSLGYEYAWYDAEVNITYRPEQLVNTMVKYTGSRWRFEWSNRILGKVYTDPDTDDMLDGSVLGYFGMQRRMMDNFFAYLRVENIYNNKYNLREGYPEPGVTFLGGLRILI
ncbi:MAG TPA: hypothetical protein ENN21_06300 [Spirochaetes bacterium]|nr:hypothetical protein [Spirochaetota bacterium]